MQKNLGQADSLGPPTGHTGGGHFTEVTQEPSQPRPSRPVVWYYSDVISYRTQTCIV
jgi:hypothetical protein